MKIYLVGGAVRDQLLHLPITERDYVVVGATVEGMLKLGYRQVGKEFPVFLHPKTNEEYALARTERKTGRGYTGFAVTASPEVTLAEDLLRRDLTINAMAQTLEGDIIDPYHGQQDMQDRWLRHVSSAFSEDPVRILRVARFLARYTDFGFKIAPETLTLMQQMVHNGEVNALVPERVWKELERALTEPHPEQFFIALADCQALSILFPELTLSNPGLTALTQTSTRNALIRFAVLLHALPIDAIKNLCSRFRLPHRYRELALVTATGHQTAFSAQSLSPTALVDFFYSIDIFRRLDRFQHFLEACQSIASIQVPGIVFNPSWLMACAHIVKSCDVHALIAMGFHGNELAEKLREHRIHAITEWLNHSGNANLYG